MTPGAKRSGDGAGSVNARRFEAIYDAYFVDVTTYCRRRVESARVDDVVAETFLTAWRRIEDVPAGDRALPWLYRVAYHVVGRQWRGRDRRRRLERRLAALPDPVDVSVEDRAVDGDELRRILRASAELNPRDAEILRLIAWEQLSRDDIAEVLEIAPNAVDQRAHRARANLARRYDRIAERAGRAPLTSTGGEQ